jgi:hypothetical protein
MGDRAVDRAKIAAEEEKVHDCHDNLRLIKDGRREGSWWRSSAHRLSEASRNRKKCIDVRRDLPTCSAKTIIDFSEFR